MLKIEERKHVRKEAAELKEKLKAQKEAEDEAMADKTFGTSAAGGFGNKTGGFSPNKTKGVGFFDQSQTSSPTKFGGSPSRKAMTGADSEADTRSVMTGGTSPMKGGMGGQMNFGVGGI